MPSLSSLIFFQSSSSSSATVLFGILALAIVGAIADWKYHRAGGKPSSRRDRILFWAAALLVAGAITLTEYAGWDPYSILASAVIPLVAWFFLAWEIGRWRMRRKYPLPQPDTGAQKPPEAGRAGEPLMANEQQTPYIEVTIYCSRCGQQQVVRVRAVLGGAQVDRQTVCCIKCKRDFDAHVPGEIIGGPFLP